MTSVYCLTVSLSLLLLQAAAADPIQPTSGSVDVTAAAKQLILDARKLLSLAKNGLRIDGFAQDFVDLQMASTDLLQQLPGEVSECETNLVIKMAAVGTGSHAVLTVLLAEDELSVLNGRLALSLAFMDRMIQQLEDELHLTGNIAPHLSAIVFGANTTATIIKSADMKVKAMIFPHKDSNSRVRRQVNIPGYLGLNPSFPMPVDTVRTSLFRPYDVNRNPPLRVPNFDVRPPKPVIPSLKLGSGFSIGPKGVSYESPSKSFNLNIKPTFKGFTPNGVGLTITF